jgi:hypothetical protein
VKRPAPARRLPLELSAAAAGLVGGHIVSYLLAAPAAPVRRVLLTQTGHGYLPRAIAVSIALAAVAAFGALFRGAARGWRAAGDPLRFGPTFRRLATAQAVGFVLLEVLERKASGATLAGLGSVLPRGLLVQVLVAAAAALALWLLDRAAASVSHALRGEDPVRRPIAVVGVPAPVDLVRRSPVALGSISLRGPPLPSRI